MWVDMLADHRAMFLAQIAPVGGRRSCANFLITSTFLPFDRTVGRDVRQAALSEAP